MYKKTNTIDKQKYSDHNMQGKTLLHESNHLKLHRIITVSVLLLITEL